MKKVFAVANHKGGVGKTTAALNIGAGLALAKRKTLLIDLDPQANLTVSLIKGQPEKTVADAIKDLVGGEGKLPIYEVKENLNICPAGPKLSTIEKELINESGREYFLKDLIDEVKDQFHAIVIDCPPALGVLTDNAFCAADGVLIPIDAYFAAHGVNSLVKHVDKFKKRLNKSLEVSGVFLNKYDERKVIDRDVKTLIDQHFKEKVFQAKIRNNVALEESPVQRQAIYEYSKKSNGAKDYTALVKEIIERFKI